MLLVSAAGYALGRGRLVDARPLTSLSVAVLAPAVAWVSAPWVGLEGVVRQTSILQSSLPTAVTAAIWASEFGVAPALVSGAVIVTTVLSPLSVAVLLTLLR